MPTADKKIKAWFDWEGDPDKARVEFSLLTDQDMAEVRSASQTQRRFFNQEKAEFELELRTNLAIDRKESALRATSAWENFFGADRKPMECTRDNIEFWSCNSGFMEFLFKCQAKLREDAAKQQEEARKNS